MNENPRAVLLDRDGVLNQQAPGGYVTSLRAWSWISGSLEACERLAQRQCRVAVATNQSAIGRGLMSMSDLERIHDRMLQDLARRGVPEWPVFFCPHRPEVGCRCRKPEPGMLWRACRHFGVEPSEAVFIGDHDTDLIAAERAGMPSVHVQSGRNTVPQKTAGCLSSVQDLNAALNLL